MVGTDVTWAPVRAGGVRSRDVRLLQYLNAGCTGHGLDARVTPKAATRMPNSPLPVSSLDAAPFRPLRVPARLYVPFTPLRKGMSFEVKPTGTIVRAGEPLIDEGAESTSTPVAP